MSDIAPITAGVQQRVVVEVDRYLSLARLLYQQSFTRIEVLFDLRGRAAGMYCVRGGLHKPQRSIRFNPWLFAKYPEDSWDNTIPHEVAHYLADCLYGIKQIKPHGKEWRDIMLALEAEPVVRANYDMTGIPMRRVQRFQYQCQCREVWLTSYRHRKVCRGLQRYQCRHCEKELVHQGV